jgi:hypothetical protein
MGNGWECSGGGRRAAGEEVVPWRRLVRGGWKGNYVIPQSRRVPWVPRSSGLKLRADMWGPLLQARKSEAQSRLDEVEILCTGRRHVGPAPTVCSDDGRGKLITEERFHWMGWVSVFAVLLN